MNGKLLGAACWMLFLLLAVWKKRQENRRDLAELQGLCRLFSHIKDSLSHFPTPLPDIYRSFENTPLFACGFLPILKEEGLLFALKSGRLHLSEETVSPFLPFAEGLGMRPYEEEKVLVKETLSRASSLYEERKKDLPRNERLSATLLFCGGLMLLLLLL